MAGLEGRLGRGVGHVGGGRGGLHGVFLISSRAVGLSIHPRPRLRDPEPAPSRHASPRALANRARLGHVAGMAPQLDYHSIRECFRRFAAAEAEPKGELEHRNAYTLLVAVALSAQATDKGVNRATRALFDVADTPEKMLALGEDALIEHIRTIGLFRNKAKNVMKLSRILVDDYGGAVPSSRAALSSLPGVGRKTANVVLNMWWRFPAQAVDTHIFRVGNRTGIAPGKDVAVVERAIEDNTPAEYALHAHHWLILHGRYVCLARKPKCADCLIRDLCLFEEKTDAEIAAFEPADAGVVEAAAKPAAKPKRARRKPAPKGESA